MVRRALSSVEERMSDSSDILRREVEALKAQGRHAQAAAQLAALWDSAPGPATASYVVRCFDELDSPRQHRRVVILRSVTVEPVVPLLRAACTAGGIALEVTLGEFNAHAQEIADPASVAYRGRPDLVFLLVAAEDLAPRLCLEWSALSAGEARAEVAATGARLAGLIARFRQQCATPLVVHNLVLPARPAAGLLDAQDGAGQSAALAAINRELCAAAAAQPDVFVLDLDGVVARVGRAGARDPRRWATTRVPLASRHLGQLASEWSRFVWPLCGRMAKCVVVDLDNTLWGGVVGEDGPAGLRLGADYPGVAYQELQRALLDLHRRGILLAVCSKNNERDALEVLERHPGMLLRPEQFAALHINWRAKSDNLRAIAAELNIGTDALLLIDDNPVERREVRGAMPEVLVPELPEDPFEYAELVRAHPALQRLRLSAEDRGRGAMYAAARAARQLETTLGSREEFLRSLAQVAEVAPLGPMNLARVAQLVGKTNQFNLTSRRRGEAELQQLAARGWQVYALSVRDRFVDNGIVGVVILEVRGALCEIDSFLLSCRVIARTVETALLAFTAARARALGAERLQGWFLPTAKNAPAADFYRAHGFTPVEDREEGSRWELDLREKDVPCPEWITLRVAQEPP
jgi:FkbH-like protein